MKLNKVIKNIIGEGRKLGRKNDLDGDGVINKKDCQPKNTMRQDYPVAGRGLENIRRNLYGRGRV